MINVAPDPYMNLPQYIKDAREQHDNPQTPDGTRALLLEWIDTASKMLDAVTTQHLGRADGSP